MEYMWKIIVVLDLFGFLFVPPSSFIWNVPVLSLQISFLRISERGSTSCKVTWQLFLGYSVNSYLMQRGFSFYNISTLLVGDSNFAKCCKWKKKWLSIIPLALSFLSLPLPPPASYPILPLPLCACVQLISENLKGNLNNNKRSTVSVLGSELWCKVH